MIRPKFHKLALALMPACMPILAAVFTAALLTSGCSVKGDMGPSGPQGAQGPAGPQLTPTYYYNSNFDTQANLSEWTVYQSGGSGGITPYLDTTLFNSPTKAMSVSVTGSVSDDSFVYQTLSFDLLKDIWVEFDWNLATINNEIEPVINIGTQVRASIGYNSATGIYLTQGSTRYSVLGSPATNVWHHVKIKYDPLTGKSTYWFDGYVLGQDYATTITPSGTPPTGNYFGIRVFVVGGSSTSFDNLRIYKY